MDGITPGRRRGPVGLPLPHLLPRQLRHDLGVRRGRSDGNERPYINADEVLLEGNASDTLTMHGAYKDPDGDTPIALTASTGAIVDNGERAVDVDRDGAQRAATSMSRRRILMG